MKKYREFIKKICVSLFVSVISLALVFSLVGLNIVNNLNLSLRKTPSSYSQDQTVEIATTSQTTTQIIVDTTSTTVATTSDSTTSTQAVTNSASTTIITTNPTTTEAAAKVKDIDMSYQQLYPTLMNDTEVEVITPKAKTVYLTFDDGPSKVTLEVLDVLEKYNIKATFFVCAQVPAQRTQASIEILNKIIEQGHEIGIHSYTHEYETIYSSVQAYLDDFKLMYDFVYENTGYEATIFRFPGGSKNSYNKETCEAIIAEMNRRGFVYYDWNCLTQDANGATYTSQELANHAISKFKENGYTIVLLHDSSVKTQTAESTEIIIEYALENGYTFEKLDNSVKPIQF